MLLSAVSVLVVAQSSSEIPEGLMNNPLLQNFTNICNTHTHHEASSPLAPLSVPIPFNVYYSFLFLSYVASFVTLHSTPPQYPAHIAWTARHVRLQYTASDTFDITRHRKKLCDQKNVDIQR